MSTPLPRSTAPHATKQLLEELDVLMQRMLALPVNELGEDAEPETSTPPDTPPLTATAKVPPPFVEERSAVPSVAEQASQAPPGMASEVVGTRLISSHAASPSLPAPHRQPESSPPEPEVPTTPAVTEAGAIPVTGFWPHPALQIADRPETPARQAKSPPNYSLPPVSRPPLSLFAQARRTRRPLTDWWLHSLLWSNRTFDHCTFWLGGPGRWLQGRAGRTVLGWLGIALLLGGLGWGLANWFDWTW